MLVHPTERVVLARLLRLLAEGERLACACAQSQAALAAPGPQQRFFQAQSRQERSHAFLFNWFADWLAPRAPTAHPARAHLASYWNLLESALHRGDLLEAVLGEQVVLEGLGEAVLHRIEAGLVTRRAPLGRLRRLLLEQEEAHAGFGARVLARAMADGVTSNVELRRRAEPYLARSHDLLSSLREDLAAIDEAPFAWGTEVTLRFPPWLA